MQQPLQITFKGIRRSQAVETRVRRAAEALERLHSRITGCRVVLEAPHRHQKKGRIYGVRVEVTVPGTDIVVSREPTLNEAHTDVNVAIRDAFAAAARQLEDHTRRRRGYVKAHGVPLHGRVVRMFRDDGYGFIETPDGLEIYFHENSVADDAFVKLEHGSEVRLELADGEGEKGPQASTVQLLGKRHILGHEPLA